MKSEVEGFVTTSSVTVTIEGLSTHISHTTGVVTGRHAIGSLTVTGNVIGREG